MSESQDDLLWRIEQLETEVQHLKTQNRQLEEKYKESQALLRPTTLHECLAACQEHVLSKIQLCTEAYRTTEVPSKSPATKHCPDILIPWDDFIEKQTRIIRLIDRIFSGERLFENVASLKTIGNRVHMCRVQDERSLAIVENNAIIDPVRVILSKANPVRFKEYSLDIPQVQFQTAAANPNDESDHIEPDSRLLWTREICVADQEDVAFVIEYKAPHKLHTSHLTRGLRQMSILDEVASRDAIPTAGSDSYVHHAELLAAAAITQTYHYMLEAGLEYGYLTNGDSIVFLNIDWSDPTVLRYHLAQPSREALVHQETAYSNAVCQVLAFTVMALQSRQHGIDERMAAVNSCKSWEVDFENVVQRIIGEDEARASGWTGGV